MSVDALNLLNIIAFLDSDQISEELLSKMKILDSVDRSAEYSASGFSFMKTRSELFKFFLVGRNRERKELIIYRIIQDAIRLRINLNTLETSFTAVTYFLYAVWFFSEFKHSTAR